MSRTVAAIAIVVVLMAALIAVIVGGGDGGTSTTTTGPATVTRSTPPPTTTVPPSTTATITSTAPVDREAEIEEIMSQVELRMWQAVYDGDVELLGRLAGNRDLYEALSQLSQRVNEVFHARPVSAGLSLVVREILMDRDDCVVARVRENPDAFLTAAEPEILIVVLWDSPDVEWRTAARLGGGTPTSEWSQVCDLDIREFEP